MPNKSEIQPVTKTSNNNTTIWWIIGACILIPPILIVIGAIIIMTGIYFTSKQTNTFKPQNTENSFYESFEKEYGNNFDKELQKELDKLEKELADLDKELDIDEGYDTENNDKNNATTGIIEGSLSYPSEVVPDLTVCAHNTSNATTDICTSDLIDDSQYTAGRGYQLEVPPGTYHVYSYFIDSTYKGIYSEYVTCGLHVGCPSHNYIAVVVSGGDHHYNIDPVDWYVP